MTKSIELPHVASKPAEGTSAEETLTEETLTGERAHLCTVFDTADKGMMLIAADGAVQQVNDTLSRWVNRDASAWEIGQPGDYVRCAHALANSAGCGNSPRCTKCSIRKAFTAVLQSGQPIHDVEAKATLVVDGREVPLWLEVSADPIVLDGQRHVVLAMSDITQRKQAEAPAAEDDPRAGG